MGSRSAVESLSCIFAAFRRQRLWSQANLAVEVGVTVKTLRGWLYAMIDAHIPLSSEKDVVQGSTQVFWSIDHAWYPEGMLVDSKTMKLILEQVARSPESPGRELLQQRLNVLVQAESSNAVWSAGSLSAEEEKHVFLVEEALAIKRELSLRYESSKSGTRDRTVTVCHVARGMPMHFVALDHSSQEYRWFRGDSIVNAEIGEMEGRSFDEERVATIVRESVDSFHDGNPAQSYEFFVRFPEANWVKRNLLSPMTMEIRSEGMLVKARVSAVEQVARFVVGLGEIAQPLTEELRAEVRRLAEGALRSANRDDG